LDNDTETSDLENHEDVEEDNWSMPDVVDVEDRDLENGEYGHKSGEGASEPSNRLTKQDLARDLEYLSGNAQVTSSKDVDVEDGDIPATTHGQMPVTEANNSPAPQPDHIPATPNQAAAQPAALPVPGVDAMDVSDNQFTVDAPETRAGRKRKTRDLHSILSVCTCGHAVSEDEILQNTDTIMCQRPGCETGWVSQIVIRN
jgi:hypothetical protein